MGNLFSNYFLKEGIKVTEDWRRISEGELDKLYSEMKKIFESFNKRERPDEADTEDGLIRPIIELLGFKWSRQKSPSKKGRRDVPDFVLFPDDKSKKDFDKEPPESKPWNKAICILEAKRWKRPLDKGDKTDPIDPHVPSNQILRYLSVAEPVSNGKIVWGILTNGELWRLYYHRSPSRSEGFVEFNLSEIFEDDNQSDDFLIKKIKFKVFYLLFRKEAFVPTNWRPHRTFLEIALDEGRRWEEKVSGSLKEKIFYEVFPDIAKGFLAGAQNKKATINNSFLDEIYNNTLVLLYRLLFIFYAEDRDLLPVRSHEYKNYSLSKIRDEIAKKIDNKESLSEIGSFYWDKIKNLFKIIDNGDKSLKIPPYNGGLFNPEKHEFLEHFSVPDKFLVPAIDKLSRDYSVNPLKRINYRDLSVRQLGSIYEGLLEFKLKIAKTHLGVKKVKKKEIYYPVDEESKAKVKKGEPYLTNDKSERKSTGSYYTPDFIVQYIVKNTIEPHAQEKIEEFRKWHDELQNTKDKNNLLKLMMQHGIKFDPKEYDAEGRIIGEKSINAYRNELLKIKDPAESLLNLKILDPAMGSGHFLVGAVDYLADRILEILAEVSGSNYFGKETYQSPLLDKLESIRSRILKKAREENYAIDEAKLDDKNLIKRIILKRCIYGVDVNPLAVELAKVSLWLHTFTVGAPLSFLDHHLKCGNSLIGANLEDFDRVHAKGSIFSPRAAGLMNAIQMIKKLQEITDVDVSEVEESGKIYDDVIKSLEPYKKLLDVYTADFFLNRKKKSQSKTPGSSLSSLIITRGNPIDILSGKVALPKKEQKLLEESLNFARNKCFFHWKLEFPEVWYEKGGVKSGFDVVIGNPPYIRIQEMRKTRPEDVEYFKAAYESPLGSYDIYILFVEKGLSLLNSKGILGYILPNKFTKLEFAQKLRQIISEYLLKFVDFGDNQIFPDQTTYTGLLFLSGSKLKEGLVAKAPSLTIDEIENWLFSSTNYFYEIELQKLWNSPWIMVAKEQSNILRKMTENSVELGEIVEQIFQGLITSADDVYILEKRGESGGYYLVFSYASGSELHLEKELLKPLVSGEDIERYYVKQSNKLLLFPYRLLPQGGAELISEEELKRRFPKIWSYLKSNENRLKGRERGKMYNKKWYGYVYPKNLDKHEKPKLGVPRLCPRLEVFWDRKGEYYFDNVDVNGILLKTNSPYSPAFLLAVLNSILLDWRFKLGSVPFKGKFFSANKQFLEPLPVPLIDFKSKNHDELNKLKIEYESNQFQNFHDVLRLYPSNSAILHDFLSFLAQNMIEFSQNKYFLQLFIEDKLEHGTDEMIKIMKLLETHPDWENGSSIDYKKEIARNLMNKFEEQIKHTDRLIDQIVYHLYGLAEEDIEIIENSLGKNN